MLSDAALLLKEVNDSHHITFCSWYEVCHVAFVLRILCVAGCGGTSLLIEKQNRKYYRFKISQLCSSVGDNTEFMLS